MKMQGFASIADLPWSILFPVSFALSLAFLRGFAVHRQNRLDMEPLFTVSDVGRFPIILIMLTRFGDGSHPNRIFIFLRLEATA